MATACTEAKSTRSDRSGASRANSDRYTGSSVLTNEVTSTRSPRAARYLARCSASTVLPVPAAPRIRAGPDQRRLICSGLGRVQPGHPGLDRLPGGGLEQLGPQLLAAEQRLRLPALRDARRAAARRRGHGRGVRHRRPGHRRAAPVQDLDQPLDHLRRQPHAAAHQVEGEIAARRSPAPGPARRGRCAARPAPAAGPPRSAADPRRPAASPPPRVWCASCAPRRRRRRHPATAGRAPAGPPARP